MYGALHAIANFSVFLIQTKHKFVVLISVIEGCLQERLDWKIEFCKLYEVYIL